MHLERLIPTAEARHLLGGIGKTTEHALRNAGLLMKPVPVNGKRVAYPASDIAAINNARIAGKSDDEIRALVSRLHAARLADDL